MWEVEELAPFSSSEETEIKCLQDSKSLLFLYEYAGFWALTIQ